MSCLALPPAPMSQIISDAHRQESRGPGLFASELRHGQVTLIQKTVIAAGDKQAARDPPRNVCRWSGKEGVLRVQHSVLQPWTSHSWLVVIHNLFDISPPDHLQVISSLVFVQNL